MVTLRIDGKKVAVPEGTTVLDAARKLDIHIPTLCFHEAITPYGGCRLCVVEVTRDGATQIASSCAYEAADGLEVKTATERVMELRKFMVELLLAEAPQAQVLQDLAQELGVKTPKRFKVRNELCIACGQCVRACREIVGVSAIDFANKGYEKKAAAPFFERSDVCIACGACAYVCPTGVMKLVHPQDRKIHHREMHLGPTTAIRVPTLQAIPNVPFIDRDACIHFRTGECRVCEKVCPVEAVHHDMQDEFEEIEVGSIIVATGYKPFDPTH